MRIGKWVCEAALVLKNILGKNSRKNSPGYAKWSMPF
jgi:hypothetical protein